MAPGQVEIASNGDNPLISTFPLSGSRIPSKISTMVVFPAPDGPTKATISPLLIVRERLLTALTSLPGYLKVTSLISIFALKPS